MSDPHESQPVPSSMHGEINQSLMRAEAGLRAIIEDSGIDYCYERVRRDMPPETRMAVRGLTLAAYSEPVTQPELSVEAQVTEVGMIMGLAFGAICRDLTDGKRFIRRFMLDVDQLTTHIKRGKADWPLNAYLNRSNDIVIGAHLNALPESVTSPYDSEPKNALYEGAFGYVYGLVLEDLLCYSIICSQPADDEAFATMTAQADLLSTELHWKTDL